MSKRSGLIGTVIVVGIVLFFLLIVLMSSYTQIHFGTVGMVTRFGRITGQIMEPGLNWKAPFVDRVIIYRTQEMVYVTEEQPGEDDRRSGTYQDYPTDTTTADGQQIIGQVLGALSHRPDQDHPDRQRDRQRRAGGRQSGQIPHPHPGPQHPQRVRSAGPVHGQHPASAR